MYPFSKLSCPFIGSVNLQRRPSETVVVPRALLDESASLAVLPEQIAGDLRLNFGVHESVQGSDPLAVNRNILLLHLHDLDVHWLRFRGQRRLRAARHAGQYQTDQTQRAEPGALVVTEAIHIGFSHIGQGRCGAQFWQQHFLFLPDRS